MLKKVFADFHIHIGRTEGGEAVKITAARNMTFANIVEECVNRKGLGMVGIVDCASPNVLRDIYNLLEQETIFKLAEGGYGFTDKLTILLGSEIETKEKEGQAHCLCFFPTLERIQSFSNFLSKHMTNVNLSSQQCGLSMRQLLPVVDSLEGILIPAHIFTPYKSVYGRCAKSLGELLDKESLTAIKAVELGLSSDSFYADYLSELANLTFLTNSDAHSLPNIGREYNLMNLAEPNYNEFIRALRREKGRAVVKNFGLDPKLGKYHRTFCERCETTMTAEPPTLVCSACKEKNMITVGVLDRLYQIKTTEVSISPSHRPPYIYQVPLRFLPKVGPKTIDKLLLNFGTEMQVLHEIPIDEIATFSPEIAEFINLARQGKLNLSVGGGGVYGKVVSAKKGGLNMSEQGVFVTTNASGARQGAVLGHVVVIVDLIDMSTTCEALLDAGAAGVYGASPDITRAPIPLDPRNMGLQVGSKALKENREVILVSEPRIGTDEERRARANQVLEGLEAAGISVSSVVPNIGAETAKITDFKDKLIIAVTDTGGVAFDAAFTAGAPAVITATIARTPFKRGRKPAEEGAERAISLAKKHNCGITVVAASANSLEDILAAEYIARLIIEKGFTKLG